MPCLSASRYGKMAKYYVRTRNENGTVHELRTAEMKKDLGFMVTINGKCLAAVNKTKLKLGRIRTKFGFQISIM